MQRRVAELAPGDARVAEHVPPLRRAAAAAVRRATSACSRISRSTTRATSRQTLKRVIEARDINTLNYSPDRLAAAISAAKNKLITADQYEPRSGSMLSRVVAEVYPAYQERLLASSAVDFDDLLLHVAQLLYEHAGDSRRARRALSLRAGRRVPGHEPGPVRDPAGPVDRLSEPGGDGRPGPVDLRLARRRPQQHSGVRARLSERARSCGWSGTTAARSGSCASPTR